MQYTPKKTTRRLGEDGAWPQRKHVVLKNMPHVVAGVVCFFPQEVAHEKGPIGPPEKTVGVIFSITLIMFTSQSFLKSFWSLAVM